MSTDFFHKKLYKKIYKIVAGVAACFTAFCCLYALFLSGVKEVALRVGFFYLVREETNVEAGAEFVRLEGGAGYLLRQDGRDYVVLSVYFQEQDALSVQANIINGENVQLVYTGVDTLYFKRAREKKNAALYVEALSGLYAYMQVLDGGIALLEKGVTQECAKGILLPLSRQLRCFAQEYEEEYPAFSSVCREYGKEIEGYCNKILFVSDLRYLLCAMTGEYLSLARAFSA